MYKSICVLLLVSSLYLQAAEVDLGTIDVETKIENEVIKDVSAEDIKSADLAEALFKQSASVSLSRRSGVANDISVRGQKKDNINVTIDGAKVCGACPNRMDPPISHILTNNVDFIEINEGPFNVEDFGVLSADIKVHTIKPKKDFFAALNLDVGSFDYKKAALKMSGGSENVRFLLSASTESSGQYKDGNGDDFATQIDNYIKDNISGKNPATQADKKLMGVAYQEKYRDLDAYKKETLMAKMFWDITDMQELKVSYTANRSKNILYPSSKMDALYDDSDMYNLEYRVKDLGRYSKELNIQIYESDVKHPMSTFYRKMGAKNYLTHTLTTKMQGVKLKNSFEVSNHTPSFGIDYSLRNWDGKYYKNNRPLDIVSQGKKPFHSIWDVDTENMAFFLKDNVKWNSIDWDMGLRYDNTKVVSGNPSQPSNTYDELEGYVLGNYHLNTLTKYFIGFGKSSRVPDGKELYWVGSMGNVIGTPNLKATINYELDMGVEKQFDDVSVKVKLFYSKLQDYIAYNAKNVNKMNAPLHAYENIDAKLYGFEFSGTYFPTDSLYFDYGVAYQRGKKERPLRGENGRNLPDIAPLKANIALNYDYDETLLLKAEVLASSAWKAFDKENGEQPLSGYGVVNLKGVKQFAKNFELTVGVDNLLDKNYAISNTYKDLILLPTAGENEVILMNEPGRYIFANLKMTF